MRIYWLLAFVFTTFNCVPVLSQEDLDTPEARASAFGNIAAFVEDYLRMNPLKWNAEELRQAMDSHLEYRTLFFETFHEVQDSNTVKADAIQFAKQIVSPQTFDLQKSDAAKFQRHARCSLTFALDVLFASDPGKRTRQFKLQEVVAILGKPASQLDGNAMWEYRFKNLGFAGGDGVRVRYLAKPKSVEWELMECAMSPLPGITPRKSGMKFGKVVSRSFPGMKDVTGPFKDRDEVCYRCELAGRPTMCIFARRITPEVIALISAADKVVIDSKEIESFQDRHLRLAGYFVLLSDNAEESNSMLKSLSEDNDIKRFPLTVFPDVEGPKSYELNHHAEVTILMWGELPPEFGQSDGRLIFDLGLKTSDLTDETISRIVKIGENLPGVK